MIVLFFTDLQYRVLPNMVTIPGVIVGWCCSWFVEPGWLDSSIGIVVGSTFLIVLSEMYYRIVGREGLGMGDVKMLALIGAFLGWELMLSTMLMASILGVLVWISILVTGRGGAKYLLPLGSFLAISATVMSAAGSLILPWWYMTIFSWAPFLF
jgi:leader peptidase (prepilin peptidase)/N-methyltransferase|tara:strand:+ start:2058 stop:2519 length:462 start_codon:yes stop_codon:yes gene_type:complete